MVEEAKVMSVMGLMMADELTTTLTMALMFVCLFVWHPGRQTS
jgi:hypothetical protein